MAAQEATEDSTGTVYVEPTSDVGTECDKRQQRGRIGNFRLVGPAGLQMHQLVRDGGNAPPQPPLKTTQPAATNNRCLPFRLELPEYVLRQHDTEVLVQQAQASRANDTAQLQTAHQVATSLGTPERMDAAKRVDELQRRHVAFEYHSRDVNWRAWHPSHAHGAMAQFHPPPPHGMLAKPGAMNSSEANYKPASAGYRKPGS